ncbi:MAG: cysteine desulfurase family protein [Chloroflexi bacterium]|nr:cysteine desulfurase family protein [Chloroflexota bacterium]
MSNPVPPIYLDNNATTPCDPVVVEAMLPYFTDWYGNAATGLHPQGRRAGRALETAREQVASLIGAQPEEMVFTGGATESNNLAILGLARRAVNQSRKRIVTTAVEHKAILEPCHILTSLGYEVIVLPVDNQGRVDMAVAAEALNEQTLLLSVQAANNEIGTLQPIAALTELAHAVGALVHCDAAQAVGKIAVDINEWGVDMLSLSAHKFYGPKGIGALYLRRGVRAIPLEPLVYGGGQERNVRSGTSNVPAIVGMGTAAHLCQQHLSTEAPRLTHLRDALEAELLAQLPQAWVNGRQAPRLPNTTSLTLPGVDADALLLNMPELMLGLGSACSSGAMEPSHVLQAIGLGREDAASTVRISWGRFNGQSDVSVVVLQILQALSL